MNQLPDELRGKTIASAKFSGEGNDQVLEIKFEDGSSLYIGPDQTLGVGDYQPRDLPVASIRRWEGKLLGVECADCSKGCRKKR